MDKPAFPNSHPHAAHAEGLTRRELFAAMAMQGMAAGNFWGENFCHEADHMHLAAKMSVKAADALIAELEKPNAD